MANNGCPLKEPDESSKDECLRNLNKPHSPETKHQGLILQSKCQCENCHHWSNSANWCPTPALSFSSRRMFDYEQRPDPLLKDPRSIEGKQTIARIDMKFYSKIQKQTMSNILVHGESLVDPTELLNDTDFNAKVQKVLQKMNYKYSTALQSFAWPAILKGMNVFLTGGKKSGKRMSYIPAICNSALEARQDNTSHEQKGPLAVIICANSSTCEKVFDLFQKIIEQLRSDIKAVIVTYPTSFRKNFDILVTMPRSFIQCYKSNMFTLKRLQFFVVEEADIVLNRNKQLIYNILEATNQMLSHRMNKHTVQLIAVSEKWTHDLKFLLKRMYDVPLVCISNHLEAAAYGGSQIVIKFLLREDKNKYLLELLKNKFYTMKTLIVCDTSEVTAVNKFLVREGIEVLALNDSATKEDIDAKEHMWTTATGGEYKVLICTDFILESLLSINDANWLINYSLPANWKLFINRYKASLKHYNSPLDVDSNQSDCRSFLMIDSSCDDKMVKISDLIGRFTRDVPASIKMYTKDLKSKIEEGKVANHIPLCDKVKLLGKCLDDFCGNRHFLSEELDIANDLPRSGKICFKILNIKNVTNYTIQIIKHIDINGRVLTINNDDLLKPLNLTQDFQGHTPEIVRIGGAYIHCDHTPNGKDFVLCHVISTVEKEGCRDDKNKLVEVRLMGGQILQTLQANLNEIPSNFGVVEAYLANLVPPQLEDNFSGRSLLVTKNSLLDPKYKNMIFSGNILLQFEKTLWLDNAVQEVGVDKDDFVVNFDLKKHLLNLEVVVKHDRAIMDSLYSLCESCNIVLPECQEFKTKMQQYMTREVEAQSAYLDDGITEVYLSSGVTVDEFYVRLAKFQRLLEDLEEDIAQAPKEKIWSTGDIAIGQYYLAFNPTAHSYGRVQVRAIKDFKASCFYLDYGDEVSINIPDLKMLPTKFLRRLPFQAICCSLHGIIPSESEWRNESLDILYDYMFEPCDHDNIFRSLFVKVCSSEQRNGDIGAKTRYSVLLKDGFGENTPLINQIMIDSGMASSVYQQFDDFTIPCYETEENCKFLDQLLENGFDDFDLEIFDDDTFLESLGLPSKEMLLSSAAVTDEKSKDTNSISRGTSNNCTIKEIDNNIVGPSSFFTPDIFWTQDENFIKVKIYLIGVQEYQCNITRKRFFEFSTMLGDQKYEVKFSLHKLATLVQHKVYGQNVRILLEKVEPLDWMQLTATSKKLRNIHYEIPKEKDEIKKRFLQLDISDDESIEEESNITFFDVSDRDSDFGGDFKDDSSDS